VIYSDVFPEGKSVTWPVIIERAKSFCDAMKIMDKCTLFLDVNHLFFWAGYRSRYSDRLRAGRSGDGIPVGAKFSAPVQTGPGAHPASSTMGTGSFPGVKGGRGVMLTPHHLLVPCSRKSRAISLLPLWAVRPVQGCTLPLPKSKAIPLLPLYAIRPVQSLSACTRVHFTFT
jgi:hypothetical protein